MEYPEPLFFASPEEFRRWLEENHGTAAELWVGFWKSGSGKRSMTWTESVDEALCFGWIDAIRVSQGSESYAIRFVPRRAASAWSAVNLKKAAALIGAGKMRAAGLAIYEARRLGKRHGYTYRSFDCELGEEEERRLRDIPAAWEYFQAQPPSYQRIATRWVMSAKRPETREARLTTLIEDCAHGRRLEATLKYRPSPRGNLNGGLSDSGLLDGTGTPRGTDEPKPR